ncbi:MAG TPA: glycosyltransferase family 1 protein, partial [Bacteroidota bacterium]|nr:glycosyltransferase family 1 protein [Bacteroidota bacterium]
VPRLTARTPVVATLHDVLPLAIPGYFSTKQDEDRYRKERQQDAERSTVIVTDSEYSKSEILRHLHPPREPVVIPCATTIGMYAADVAPGPTPYFLYVGGLDPRKSLDTLLDVFCRLRSEGSLSATLVVTGSSRHAPPALSAQLREAVSAGHAEATGYVNDRELARLYAGALALVYPSRYEGFGMPPLEAMTLGCPVIAARASSIPEVCADAALYIEPWSPRGIAEAVRRMADDASLRERLRGEGTARAAQFSWEKAADTFVRLLERL